MTIVSGSRIEHRQNMRYLLNARAVFSWEGPEQKQIRAPGLTRDVGLVGAFIFSLTCPPVGTTVEVALFLPPMHGTVPTARLRGQGRVLRVESAVIREEQNGFAVASEGFGFLPLKGSDAESADERQDSKNMRVE